eukprot:1906002-Ditylum_brightwellii.AAC.1
MHDIISSAKNLENQENQVFVGDAEHSETLRFETYMEQIEEDEIEFIASDQVRGVPSHQKKLFDMAHDYFNDLGQ